MSLVILEHQTVIPDVLPGLLRLDESVCQVCHISDAQIETLPSHWMDTMSCISYQSHTIGGVLL